MDHGLGAHVVLVEQRLSLCKFDLIGIKILSEIDSNNGVAIDPTV